MTSQNGRAFNEWLRAQLKAKKMSQRQLAQQSGVDHSTISPHGAKEIGTRFDFRGVGASIAWSGDHAVEIKANSEERASAVLDVFKDKLVKRKVSLKALDYATVEQAAGATVRQKAKIVQGIEGEKAKAIVRTIKDAKLKVQASIQSDQVRVVGRSKDDLQKAMALVREQDFGIPLQFTNYRG